MARVRMYPPIGSISPTYNGVVLGSEGVLVFTLDVDALRAAGWTVENEKHKTPPEEQPKNGLTEEETKTASDAAKARVKKKPTKRKRETISISSEDVGTLDVRDPKEK